jgi:hypothetical protein
MIYVGTFSLKTPSEFVETLVAPPNFDDTPFYVFDNDGFGENKRGMLRVLRVLRVHGTA